MKELTAKIAEIYSRYGIKSITMDELARELGISKKTLYIHFKDKNQVVCRVVDYLIEIQKYNIEKLLTEENKNAIDKLLKITMFFVDNLREVNVSLTYDLQKYYPEIWAKVNTFKENEIFTSIMSNLKSGVDEGLYRSDINFEIIASVYISRMEMYLSELWQPIKKYSIAEVFETIFIYHIRGIATQKGINYLEKNKNNWAFR